MLERISWGQYWVAVLILSAIYYFILLMLLFQKGMLTRQKGLQPVKPREAETIQQTGLSSNERIPLEKTIREDDEEIIISNDSLMPLVHDYVQELKEFITDIAGRSYVKEEVIMGLQIITRNYKKLDGSPYQQSINDFILHQSEENCSIHLSAEDLKRIWLGG